MDRAALALAYEHLRMAVFVSGLPPDVSLAVRRNDAADNACNAAYGAMLCEGKVAAEIANLLPGFDGSGRVERARLALLLRVLLRDDGEAYVEVLAEKTMAWTSTSHFKTQADVTYYSREPQPKRYRPLWEDAPPHRGGM
jgi:hypothetical protein